MQENTTLKVYTPSTECNFSIDDQQVIFDCLSSRRTVQQFAEQQPQTDAVKSAIKTAIQTAIAAPNHGLTEPWDWHYLGQQTVDQIIALNTELLTQSKGAIVAEKKRERWQTMPHWVVMTQTLPTDSKKDKELVEQEDYAACACAAQNFMLSLWAQGYGSKWSTGSITRHNDFYKLLNIDPNTTLITGIFWIGAPAENKKNKPKRRRSVDDVFHTMP